MSLLAQTAKIWSAVTCHRFGRLGRLVGQAEPRPAVRETNGMLLAGDGDKSPAKSGDKSLHSISLNRD
jgi:hypothetical protein